MKVLHIIASPRGTTSNTVRVADAFLKELQSQHEVEVSVLDLFKDSLPAIAGDNIEAKYALVQRLPMDPDHAESWQQIEALIEQFKAADLFVISAPMWNLSVPYALKYFIDCIVQPGYAFRYNEFGQVVPLILGKKMVCVTARGGDYSANSPYHAYDLQEPYLRGIFGFIGITDIEFINIQPTDITPDLREAEIGAALESARELASSTRWSAGAETTAPPAQ
ncbi:MAG: NAD(P)H-dependent oxidoreductase [Micropruina sp.]|nr:NAD(P)H-dependent oxidoreductase [Micropruina sp.]